MSLRITQGHLYAVALNDIRNGLGRYTALQHEVATGRRVNLPSDDPAAALRIIPLTNDIRNLDQFSSNVSMARETLDAGASSLEDGSSLMQRIREITVQAANGTLNTDDRHNLGIEVDQLLNQLISIGNSKRGDRYLFGGTASNTAPFTLVSSGNSSRVVYNGNHQSLTVEVAPGLQTALNLPGDSIFQKHSRGDTTFSGGNTGAQPTNHGDTGIGFQNLTVGFNGLHTDAPSTVTAGNGQTTALGPLAYTFTTTPPTLQIGTGAPVPLPANDTDFDTGDGRTINLTVTGPAVPATGTFTSKAGLSTDGGRTVTDVSDFTNTSVVVRNGDDQTVLDVDVRALGRTGQELVKYSGTFDAFTTLITVRDLLRNDQNLPIEEVQSRLSGMLPEVDQAHTGVLDGLRELGFRSSSMDTLTSRVASLKIASQQSLSLVQDADLSQVILQLQQQDMAYTAALQVSAKVIQTSLAGYLR
jgi:flagellar hook-associated protein 3 FlgL